MEGGAQQPENKDNKENILRGAYTNMAYISFFTLKAASTTRSDNNIFDMLVLSTLSYSTLSLLQQLVNSIDQQITKKHEKLAPLLWSCDYK